jgi:hypothetical protein
MVFSKNDFYTTSGNVQLYHCWTDKVTKFDSSSFYNWEQDNMPIYDLEERTFYLWEQLGYPTSAIPGVALVVSADANAAKCNSNVFKTVSAAVAALPQIINYPIVIEVANFGQLGELRLNNYKFGPRGSLEIINRNFASILPLDSNLPTIVSGAEDTLSTNAFNAYKYASATLVDDTIAIGYSGTYPTTHFRQASALAISSTVFSSTFDSRLSSNAGNYESRLNGIVKPLSMFSLAKSTLFIGNATSPNPYEGTYNLAFRAYEYGPNSSDAVTTKDVSTINTFTNNHIYYAKTPYGTDPGGEFKNVINGLFYGSKLSKIIVNNCDGPIYIRDFFVDGSGSSRTDNDYGVEINNSPNIYLESIVSTRFRRAGFSINNSNVTLLRGCVGTRNYDFSDNNIRLTNNWQQRIRDISFLGTSGYLSDDDSAGLVANNSTITVSSTSGMESALIKNTLGSLDTYYCNSHYIYEFSKNANGIVLNNSTFKGGAPEVTLDGITDSKYNNINISIEGNVGYGLKLQNSQYAFDGRTIITENLNGVLCDSSIFEIDKILVGLNQRKGIELINSVMKYNRNRLKPSQVNEADNQFIFSGNGQHLDLLNSKMIPFECSSMNDKYGKMRFTYPIGLTQFSGASINGMLPSVSLKNNSEAVFIHSQFDRTNTSVISKQACKGSEIAATNGSMAILKGSASYATKIVGPAERINQSKLAAVYAGGNSLVEINGPTVIYQYGINILGEDNSIINIGPHRDRNNGAMDVSSFNLIDRKNHTAVELHSTRACIVVNRLSTLNIKDLGSYKKNWSRGNLGTSSLLSGVDYIIDDSGLNIEKYVSGGFLQFYPNPNDDDDYTTEDGKDNITPAQSQPYFYPDSGVSSHPTYYLISPTQPTNQFSSITNGGMCVRAVDNSIVNVQNVNFPCGWWNASGPYYDTSSVGENKLCNRLFIWNIADKSQIKASLISVSGLFPADAGYVGPSGNWCSGTNCSSVASGLPSTTPDTSSLSVLDYFGRSTANPYGKSASAQNFGPFRLFFSVNPVVNVLNDLNTNTNGVLTQIYAQGYQPSSSLSAVGTTSALYPMIMQRNSGGNIVPSGYYYGSSMMHNNGYINAYLDESASETFANAKHCAVGKSGLARLVSINFPYYNVTIGDSATNAKKALGRGLKSVSLFDLERDN